MLSVIICIMIIMITFGGGYLLIMYLNKDDVLRASHNTPASIDYSQYCYSDDLGKSILALINDIYSPYYPASLCDHIVSDLDIDSLDIVDLMYDVEQICGTKLCTFELYQQYGRNPTIAQLISYTRQKIETCNPETRNPETCNNS